ncbi:MAG TPA: M56 family metallopeptidase [Verrucomicrobiae bacterium]
MNNFTHAFEEIFRWVLQTSWQATVLAGLILLAQWLLRKRLSAGWRYGLWLLLVGRLLMPATPQSALSVFNLIRSKPRTPPVAHFYANTQSNPYYDRNSFNGTPTPPASFQPGPIETSPLPAPPNVTIKPPVKIDWFGLALCGWLAGVCFFGARLIWVNARFRSRIATCRPVADGDAIRVFDECRAALNITQPIRVVESEEVETPAVYGLWRKWLLLPDGVFERFGEGDLRCIFLHELAHIKRSDLGVNWLVSVLQVGHWFNPVLRLAFARMRSDREMATDALALAHIGNAGNVAYGETILKVVENLTRDAAQPGLVGIAESKAGLAQRVRAIAQFSARRHWKWAALAAAIVVAGVGLTDARQTTAPVIPPSQSTTKTNPVREITGVIVDPDGNPADGAQVAVMIHKIRPQIAGERMTDSDLGLSGQPRLFSPSSGHLMGETRTSPWNYCTTGHGGRFDLDDLDGATFLMVADKKGFARIASHEFSADMTVKLNKWGRIEGSVWDYSKTVADEPVVIGPAKFEDQAWGQKVKFETNTDSRGRFIFDYVPPARFTVYSEGISQMFTVESGKTAAVKVGGDGRTVVGKFKFPDSNVQIDWDSRNNDYTFVPEPVRPSKPFKTSEEYIAWMRQRRSQGWDPRNGIITYEVKCAPDGSFRIDQVQPGNYGLFAGIHDRKGSYGSKFIGQFDGLNRGFSIPASKSDGAEPVDLGVIELSPSPKEKPINATPPPINHASAHPVVTNGPAMKVTVVDAQTGQPVRNAEVLAPNDAGFFGRNREVPQWTTDENGMATIRLGEPGPGHLRKISWFTISIRGEGYAPHGLSWSVNNADARQMMPEQLTVKLVHGANVGGTVVDEEGAPIAGVQVSAYGSSYWKFSAHEYPEYWTESPAITDAQGHWTLKDFPDDLEYVSIKVSWPGGTFEQYTTSPTLGQPDNFRYQNPGEDFSLADFRAGKLSLTLRRGRTVQGVVLDPKGFPMAEVLLKAGCGLFISDGRLPEIRTDDSGRFEFDHLLRREIAITADSGNNYALTSIIVDTLTNDRPVQLHVAPLNPLRIHVEDGDGHSIAGAEITVDPSRSQGQVLDFTAKTDQYGNFVWTNAPVSEFALRAKSPMDGIEQKIRVSHVNRNITFKLRSGLNKEVIVTALAQDEKTGAEVTLKSLLFEIADLPSENGWTGNSEVSGAISRLTIPATIFTESGTYPAYELEAQADGYATTYSGPHDYDEGDQEGIVFLLEKANRPGQVVLLPDGSTGSRTTVWSHFDRNKAKRLSIGYPQHGVVRGNGLTSTGTRKDGSYDLPGEPDNAPVIFTHDDGFLQTTVGELKRHPRVQLKPYGHVQGVLRVAGQPKKEMRVCIATSDSELQPYFVYCYDSTDSNGQFNLTDLPPGNYTLFRTLYDRPGPIIRDHQMAITLKAGETLKVDYSNQGRQVLGRAVSDDPTVEIDWLRDNHTLTRSDSKRALLYDDNNGNDYVTEKAWRNAWDAAHAKAVQSGTGSTYLLVFKRDGSFQMDDIPPGKYWLSILVRKPGSRSFGSYPEFEDVLGSFEREIVVPEGEGPFNLGELTVKTKDQPRSGS